MPEAWCAIPGRMESTFLRRKPYPSVAPARVQRSGSCATLGFEDERMATRHDRESLLHVVLDARHSPHDPLPRATTMSFASGRRCTRPVTACTRTGSKSGWSASRLHGAPSLGLDESARSRGWENLVARRAPFLRRTGENHFQATIPARLEGVHLETFLTTDQPRGARIHPRGGGRDDVQPPHPPALQHQAAASWRER